MTRISICSRLVQGLETQLATIRREREMLDLRHTTLERRQELIEQCERRLQQAQLRLSQMPFQLLVESLPCLICHLDYEQRFRFCNKEYRNSLGIAVRNI